MRTITLSPNSTQPSEIKTGSQQGVACPRGMEPGAEQDEDKGWVLVWTVAVGPKSKGWTGFEDSVI